MNIKIKSIDTTPEHDPYANIEGVVSRTFLKLDPEAREAWVTQEYQDNSTSMREWNGLVISWCVNSHPSEADMRQWIETYDAELTTICNGFERRWNGSNHVGSLSEEAHVTFDSIEWLFDNDAGPDNYYEVWTVESWLDGSLNQISADMSDEQLAEFAEAAEPGSEIVVLGDILKYLTQHRDNLEADQEDE